MSGLVVKPRSRIFHGHDWVYGTEVLKVFGEPKPGDVVSLKDNKDRMLGSAIFNPVSQIIARRFSRQRQDLDADFFQRRVTQALKFRERLPGYDPRRGRVIWSESDGLPGVIVDRYGDFLVVQTLTKAMDDRKELLADALMSALAPRGIIERNEASVRRAEGMELISGVLRGEAPEGSVEIELAGGLRFAVDLLGGQKTGFYLDQVENYAAVAAHAHGRRVLDCFTSQGAFALACARAGAAEVTGVEIGPDALAAARANGERNDLKVNWVEANVFDYLPNEEKRGARHDLIILDPPSFTRTKARLDDALRGYKEIHLRALKLLPEGGGGLLATFCCSHHVNETDFRGVIAEACVDAKRTLREVARFTQAPDHPRVLTLPETAYLQGYLFELMPGR